MKVSTWVAFVLVLGLGAAPASAGLNLSRVTGEWAGDMIIKVADKTQRVPMRMTFRSDGKVVVVGQRKQDKMQTLVYEIHRDHILLKSPTRVENDVKLTDVQLTSTTLTATMLSALRAKPRTPDFSIVLDLKRVKTKGATAGSAQ